MPPIQKLEDFMKEEWRKAGYLETAPPMKKKKEVAIRPAGKVYKRGNSVRRRPSPKPTPSHPRRPGSQSLCFADAQTGRETMLGGGCWRRCRSGETARSPH